MPLALLLLVGCAPDEWIVEAKPPIICCFRTIADEDCYMQPRAPESGAIIGCQRVPPPRR